MNDEEILGVSWMGRRDDATGKCYAHYFSASADGGKTFSNPIKVSSKLSCPDYERLGFAGRRWKTGGDYFGIVAAKNGRFHLLWTDARNGLFELWTATVTIISNQN